MSEVTVAMVKSAIEKAWRDGFQSARDCLTANEASCLTEDVEQDAWHDSKTRALLNKEPAR